MQLYKTFRYINVTFKAERYPAVDYNAFFSENRIARVFKEASDFRKKFHNMDSLLSNGDINPSDFIDLYPWFVIDVSHHSERLKESTVDIPIRVEFARIVPANTEAFALQIESYSLNQIVRKWTSCTKSKWIKFTYNSSLPGIEEWKQKYVTMVYHK